MGTEIHDAARFRETVRMAKALGGEAKKSLFNCMKILNRIRKNRGAKLYLYPDFVKHSWAFGLVRNGKTILNGGLILHGFEQTFSVEMSGTNHPHWSLHT